MMKEKLENKAKFLAEQVTLQKQEIVKQKELLNNMELQLISISSAHQVVSELLTEVDKEE